MLLCDSVAHGVRTYRMLNRPVTSRGMMVIGSFVLSAPCIPCKDNDGYRIRVISNWTLSVVTRVSPVASVTSSVVKSMTSCKLRCAGQPNQHKRTQRGRSGESWSLSSLVSTRTLSLTPGIKIWPSLLTSVPNRRTRSPSGSCTIPPNSPE